MPEPIPESPRDAGVHEGEPEELGQQETAHLIANDARDHLHGDGFSDAQIDTWAEAFVAERGAGGTGEFVTWIARQERGGGR